MVFLKNSVEIEGLQYEGGTIRPTIENSTATRLTKDRSEQLLKMKTILKTH